MIFIQKPGKETYDDESSWRPITLTTYLFKALERIQLWHAQINFLANHPIVDYQYAFLKGKSTEAAISRVVDKIESALNRNRTAIGVFLDIQGAFDNMDHDSIIRHLKHRGFDNQFIDWYNQYLRDRLVVVDLAGFTISRRIARGTPQGGILSPIIWNIVFDSCLKRLSVLAFTTGFADDGCIIVTGSDTSICRDIAQRALDMAISWGSENGLTFSKKKTIVIHFNKTGAQNPKPLTLADRRLPFENETKYLGVIISHNLDWTSHIKYICMKTKALLFSAISDK